MDTEVQHPWETPQIPKLAETPGGRQGVIPLVSPERAAQVFSSQRVMSLEEGWRQVDISLGRLKGSK